MKRGYAAIFAATLRAAALHFLIKKGTIFFLFEFIPLLAVG